MGIKVSSEAGLASYDPGTANGEDTGEERVESHRQAQEQGSGLWLLFQETMLENSVLPKADGGSHGHASMAPHMPTLQSSGTFLLVSMLPSFPFSVSALALWMKQWTNKDTEATWVWLYFVFSVYQLSDLSGLVP